MHRSSLSPGVSPADPSTATPTNPNRRRWLQGTAVAAWGWPLAAAAQSPAAVPTAAREVGSGVGGEIGSAGGSEAGVETGDEPPRLALLLGNRDYPGGEDLPPIHKNVRDLGQALKERGFTVTEGLDLSLEDARQAMAGFAAQVRAAPPQTTAFFYYSGHGAQVDAENLLVSARLNPKSRADVLARSSLAFTTDVVGQLPQRPSGLTIAVIDACRTSLREVARGEGLNQVEAPPGTLVAFATGAGRPAIAPADDTRNTFYTASLVKLLAQSSGEISFSDLFRLVKLDVQQTMLNHPVPLLRQFAQFPFIAENTQVSRRLAPRIPAAVAAVAAAAARPGAAPLAPPRFADSNEADDWARVQAAVWPADVVRAAAHYLSRHPNSQLAGSAVVAREGAAEAAQILSRSDVRLFRSAFQPAAAPAPVASPTPAPAPAPATDSYGYAPPPAPAPAAALPPAPPPPPDVVKAGRGDKDAAARVARSWGRQSGRWNVGRYEGWMQYAAALGNGIASYELALHYRRADQPLLAAQFEDRARELGYTPPPSLDNSRK